MRRSLTHLGTWVGGFCALLSPLAAQEIIQTHGLLRNQTTCEEPQRIVIKLPPPRVEYKERCAPGSDSSRRFCVFSHRHKSDDGRSGAAGPSMLWAPATLPTMFMPAPAQSSNLSLTQQISHDFSSLRTAHEMEVHAAGLAAHLAARNAMINAENDAMQRIMDRTRGKMEALSSACASSAQPGVAAEKSDTTRTSLDAALRKLNDRLDRLEDLVLLHQQLINSMKQSGK